MRLFLRRSSRALVGSVLTVNVDELTATSFHLFAYASESVRIHLLDLACPTKFYERRVNIVLRERSVNYPRSVQRPMPHRRCHRLPIAAASNRPTRPWMGEPMTRRMRAKGSGAIDVQPSPLALHLNLTGGAHGLGME